MPAEPSCGIDGPVLGYRIARWKRDTFRRFLGSRERDIVFADGRRRALQLAHRDGRTCLGWAADVDEPFRTEAARLGVPVVLVEDGFLRSIGLGASFLPPASMVFDRIGIYYDARHPSGLEAMLAGAELPQELLARAAALRSRLIAARLTKYNAVGAMRAPELPQDRHVVLAVGQVEDDASIRCGLGEVRTNLGLLEAVRRTRPDAFIVYKPHPDVEAGLRRGHVPPSRAGHLADIVVRDLSSVALLEHVAEVHTISSLLGFEALLRGLEVTTYGSPFYAGWGLTEDHVPIPRRGRRIGLDELVAATLILYPSYIDPATGCPCEVETVVERLAAGISVAPDRRPQERLRRLYRKGYGLVRRGARMLLSP